MNLSAFRLPALALLAALSTGAVAAKTLDVVASFTVLADVVRQVGGDRVVVRSLVPPNGDPHDFEPSPDDARSLKAADLAFVSGEGLESWFSRLAKAAGAGRSPVVVSDGVAIATMKEEGRTVRDPHVWNSAANVIVWTANVEKALSAADPADAAVFRANAARFTAELQELDAYAKSRIAAVPKDRRKVLTSHDAFGYFGRAYGVTFLSPLGVTTDSEASAADVARLVDQIRRERVKVYFIENSNDPRMVRQIARATGAEPGGTLFVESLSGPDGPAPTYARMFRQNVDLMADAMLR